MTTCPTELRKPEVRHRAHAGELAIYFGLGQLPSKSMSNRRNRCKSTTVRSPTGLLCRRWTHIRDQAQLQPWPGWRTGRRRSSPDQFCVGEHFKPNGVDDDAFVSACRWLDRYDCGLRVPGRSRRVCSTEWRGGRGQLHTAGGHLLTGSRQRELRFPASE